MKKPAIQNNNHILYLMRPFSKWDIYIDENGSKFSNDENGKDGRIVAICLHEKNNIPNLGLFHCVELEKSKVVQNFKKLLNGDCGIIGFSQKSLDINGKHGWLQTIHELILWVWRLVPINQTTKPIFLSFHIEQRSEFSASLQSMLSEKMLSAEFYNEDPIRARKVKLLNFKLEKKGAPYLAWPDIVAYLWGSKNLSDYINKSRLIDKNLVDCSPNILRICKGIFKNEMPNGKQFIELVNSADDKESLQNYSLSILQKKCINNPNYWEIYSKAMQQYLASKVYSLPVLERMSQWLQAMNNPSLEAKYFWYSSEFSRLNHMGDVDSKALQNVKSELDELTPKMQLKDPTALLNIVLRLSVSDSNAFDFAHAEKRLAAWNPAVGGQLLGSALWDGKILSSLGQFRAFQNDFVGAITFFRQAIKKFNALTLADPQEGKRQIDQTRTYLAIAMMDDPESDTDEMRHSVAVALNGSIKDAIQKYGKKPLAPNPYPHYLLARYLAYAGTEEERNAYRNYSDKWTESSMYGSGHPWPQIQYFRWLMTDDDDDMLKKELKKSISIVRGKDNMPTVELIVLAISLSMSILSSKSEAVQKILYRYLVKMPCAESIIRQMMTAEEGDRLLAKRIICLTGLVC